MAGPTEQLAEFASGLSLAAIPAEAITHAERSILDTFGCALHGSTLPWTRILQDVATEEGSAPLATVWGTGQRRSRTQAAWLNSAAAHGFEFDDVHMGGMIHVGALTVPAALAVVEGGRASGGQLLAAVIAGVEVGARVGQAVGTPHFRAGYHPQGTVGVFAAAAAAGRMLDFDPPTMVQALGIAGSHAAGLMAAQRGAMSKRLHSGHAAQSGVLAALLAARGFTGIADVFEADFGGFLSTMGGGSVDPARLTVGLGTDWETTRIGFKPFPSCAAAQSSIEAVRLIRERAGLRADDVAEIVLRTSEHAYVHSGWAYEPAGVTAAQMSIVYGVARVLLDGVVSVAHFDDDAIAEPAVLEVARRVRVIGDPAIDALGSDHRYIVHASVVTTSGQELSQSLDDRPGNDTTPLAPGLLEAKFADLTEGVIGAEAAGRLRAMVENLDSLENIAPLMAALAGGEK